MAKTKTVFVCSECGYETGKWLGKCPGCGNFATMSEEVAVAVSAAPPRGVGGANAVPLADVKTDEAQRVHIGIKELDRVLGGGVVQGSSILLGGDPGIGKSTLMLQAASALALNGPVLYVSGEESSAQIALRADRLDIKSELVYLLGETELSAIAAQVEKIKPRCIIIDSVQTMYASELTSAPGSVSQVRQATAELTRIGRSHNATLFIIGHVTKDGAIAGPRVLEHMVDTVLYFEGGRYDALRVLRAVKNRFGSTNEIGLFEMAQQGMVEVPYNALLTGYDPRTPGCAVTATVEGSRAVLLEIQALLSGTPFGNPRRVAAGVDYNRMVLLMAVLEKKIGMHLGDQDAFLNVVGGIRLEERAADLAIAFAVASSFRNKCADKRTALIGEIGLTGEVRGVTQMEKRVRECEKLGMERVILPRGSAKDIKSSIELCGVETVEQALEFLQ